MSSPTSETVSTPLKRKATTEPAALQPRRIRPLDETVVNKIAAGEIIVAPVNALKELIENSVDAGATSVDITAKDGGLKLLQITDNGCGINKEDLGILCERHTTSKLKEFKDLESIGTYGFRGEALASISHVAHLTVTTKTRDSDRAWRAYYQDGVLAPVKPGQSAEPKAVAGVNGTQLKVEDLFYNMPNRRRAFRSTSEEYQKILDVVGRYAVHCEGVAFSCKKYGDSDASLSVSEKASTVDRIRSIHGSAVANELIPFDVSSAFLGFTAKGYVSNVNYSVKKTTLLLFINERAVESIHIKRSLEQTYATVLPKSGKPFAYLSLSIEPHRVDVNVHPTKRHVNFLNEDEIIEMITGAIGEKLASIDTSRTFLTQTLLPGAGKTPTAKKVGGESGAPKTPFRPPPTPTKLSQWASTHRADNNLNRVDPTSQKITSIFKPTSTSTNPLAPEAIITSESAATEWVPVNYRSIRKLREEITSSLHPELHEILHNHVFVGMVDEHRRFCAIQHSVKMYLVNYAALAHSLFFQIGVSDFSNFGRIEFPQPLDLRSLLSLAISQEKARVPVAERASFDWEHALEIGLALLLDKRDMLAEYFSLSISADGKLESIPLLLRGYTPPLSKLPAFLLSFGPEVDWTAEYPCFRDILRLLARFYTPERVPVSESGLDEGAKMRRAEVLEAVEGVLMPAVRKRLVPGEELRGEVQEVANLKGLYRIFERC